MIKIGLNDIKGFKSILSVAETILTEVKFELDNDGLRFRGMDGGHTSYFEADFKKDCFLSYDLDEIDSIIIDTHDMNTILKRVKNTDDATIIINDDVLTIQVLSDGNEKSFKLNSIDMEYDSPNMPLIEYPVSADVDFNKFKDNVMDANLYDDRLRVKVEENNLIIHNKSMIGSYESKLQLDEDYQGNLSSVFSMNLISKFLKLSTLSNNVEISLGSDMPILFTLVDDFEDITIKLLIAPIIEEDY